MIGFNTHLQPNIIGICHGIIIEKCCEELIYKNIEKHTFKKGLYFYS